MANEIGGYEETVKEWGETRENTPIVFLSRSLIIDALHRFMVNNISVVFETTKKCAHKTVISSSLPMFMALNTHFSKVSFCFF
jgi:hypothetical protein